MADQVALFVKIVILDGYFCRGYNAIHHPSDMTRYAITLPHHIENIKSKYDDAYFNQLKAPIFDESAYTVTINGLEGILRLSNASDVANDFVAFTVSITYEPDSYEPSEDPVKEESEYLDNLIWSSRAVYNNGTIKMSGDFAPSHFTVTLNDGPKRNTEIALSAKPIIVSIPEEYNLDDLSVNIGVDAGNLGYGISEKFNIREATNIVKINEPHVPEGIFEFQGFPNPVQDDLIIKTKLPYTTHGIISLIDSDGNLVKTLYKGEIRADQELELEQSLKGLPRNRIYFLELSTHQERLARKIILK